MFARFLALYSLGLACLFAASPDAESVSLSIYFSHPSSLSSRSLAYMKLEAGTLMQAAGYRVDWRELGGPRDDTASNLVVVTLEGDCSGEANWTESGGIGEGSSNGPRPLASTSVANGVVLPFSRVHCSELTAVLGPALAKAAGPQRAWIYGRALGRVIAHELYHALSGSSGHDTAGVAKSCFSYADLAAEKFAFEPGALAKLRRGAAEGDAAVRASDAIVR